MFLTILLFVLAVIFIVLVMIQPDRSNGMTGSIGSGSSNQLFGVAEDGGPLPKITAFVAVAFLIVALIISIMSKVGSL